MYKSLFLLSIAACTVLADSFTLGQINVLNTPVDESVFEEIVNSDAIEQHNSETVAEALDNVSGVSMGMVGARNEATVSIRGFDAKRIGVFIDGIPVYVPYDGNFDYDRFLTSDIGEIDVFKGYSPVAYGANTMGGVINIISKKPTRALQGDLKGGIVLDSDGTLSRSVTSINLGTRQEHLYAQLGGVYSKQDHYRLSDAYTATASQPAGDRLQSSAEDYKISFKAGYVADDASEVALGYASQKGQKEQPPSTDPVYSKVRYWDWPLWDKESVFVTGQKNLGNGYLKALAYYDTFTNSLYSYDDATYTTMNKGSSFKSRYEDYSFGARLEYAAELGSNLITVAANYKKDVHKGYSIDKTDDLKTLDENYEDNTLSFGLEDTYTLSSAWTVLGGISYDIRKADKIYDTNTAYIDMLALETQSAFNPEAAVIYAPDLSSRMRASISQKTYMPSMKDRYSRKFNSYVPNVELENEISTQFELSYQKSIGALSTTLNGFFIRVDDAIQSVVYAPDPAFMQNQNVGSFDHRGAEAELNYKTGTLEAGGNYTFTSIKNRTDENIKRTDVPRHQLFAFTQIDLLSSFAIYGDMRFRKGAYDQISDGSYVIVPTFATFGLKAIYQPIDSVTAEAGVKNLTDKLVQYDMGFPVAGREFFATLAYKF
ncbi:TonB-dependent receptor [bacterium]|jgi:iron complex outermembrane receptor protein|nr:TonB-dependent receptor [bacterium]